MARTRNISIGLSAELHARYAELGLAGRRAVLAEVRMLLASRLQGAGSAGGKEGGAAAAARHAVSATAPAPGRDESGQEGFPQEAGLTLPLGW